MTLDPNVEKHLIKKIAKEAVEAATAIYDYLPDADTCIVTLNGPDGPLAECTVLVGNSAAESIPMKTDQYGNFRAPVGAPEFKVDAIGLVEATVAAITDNTPRVINMVALSCGAFVLACLFGLGSATAGEAPYSLTDGHPTVCQCGPECDCGDDCQCTTVALASESEATAVAESSGGNVRRAALKMFLRRQATKAALRGDRAKARQLREALNDDDALDSIVDAIDADEKLSLPVSADGAIVDQIIKLLQWLIDNADAIIAIVMKIIPLFADPAQPTAALLDAPAGWSEWPLALAC